jgi:hypothetical protein
MNQLVTIAALRVPELVAAAGDRAACVFSNSLRQTSATRTRDGPTLERQKNFWPGVRPLSLWRYSAGQSIPVRLKYLMRHGCRT